jgi:hypothetical protein
MLFTPGNGETHFFFLCGSLRQALRSLRFPFLPQRAKENEFKMQNAIGIQSQLLIG